MLARHRRVIDPDVGVVGAADHELAARRHPAGAGMTDEIRLGLSYWL